MWASHPLCGQEKLPEVRINTDFRAVGKTGRINIKRLGARRSGKAGRVWTHRNGYRE